MMIKAANIKWDPDFSPNMEELPEEVLMEYIPLCYGRDITWAIMDWIDQEYAAMVESFDLISL